MFLTLPGSNDRSTLRKPSNAKSPDAVHTDITPHISKINILISALQLTQISHNILTIKESNILTIKENNIYYVVTMAPGSWWNILGRKSTF